jgi:hypothetical protein
MPEEEEPTSAVIELATLRRTGSVSWWLMPLGPMRENRNGTVAASSRGASVGALPSMLSPSSPSPST